MTSFKANMLQIREDPNTTITNSRVDPEPWDIQISIGSL